MSDLSVMFFKEYFYFHLIFARLVTSAPPPALTPTRGNSRLANIVYSSWNVQMFNRGVEGGGRGDGREGVREREKVKLKKRAIS